MIAGPSSKLRVVWLASWWPRERHPEYGQFNRRWALLLKEAVDLAVFVPHDRQRGAPVRSELRVHKLGLSGIIRDGAWRYSLRAADVVHLFSASTWGLAAFTQVGGTSASLYTDHSLSHTRPDVGQVSRQRRLATRVAVGLSDGVVPVSEEQAAYLRKTFPRASINPAVRNVPDERFLAAGAERQASASSSPRVLHVSGLHEPVKRVGLLLRSFATLREQDPAAHLTVVGSGGHEAELRETAAALRLGPDALQWAGRLTSEGVAREMTQATVLAMPSVREVDNVVVTEALAARLPVVATDVAGMREKVGAERGLLLPVATTPEQLARAIEAAHRRWQGAAPPLTGREAYQPDRVRATLLATYARAVAARRAG